MTQPAVTVPAGPTSCARRRLAREGSAYPARRGVHTLHTVSLFRPSPKVAMNPLNLESYNMVAIFLRFKHGMSKSFPTNL